MVLGPWRRYEHDIVRIGRLPDLARARAFTPSPRLPAGDPVDVQLTNAALRPLLAKVAGGRNLVVPEHVDGKLTVLAKGVASHHLLEASLEALELGYRYVPAGNIVRVARLPDLEREDEDEDAPER